MLADTCIFPTTKHDVETSSGSPMIWTGMESIAVARDHTHCSKTTQIIANAEVQLSIDVPVADIQMLKVLQEVVTVGLEMQYPGVAVVCWGGRGLLV